MNKSKQVLYAIYKDGNHMGNERGVSAEDSIIQYLKVANFPCDSDLLQKYSAIKAIEGIHHHIILKE